MDNDIISKQIRQAAENAEQAPFPGMDKVWSRVEDKLDHKMLSRQKKYWKKLAVAASVLLVGSVAYQFLKETPHAQPKQQEKVTAIDTTTTRQSTVAPTENAIVESTTAVPTITKETVTVSEVQTERKQDSVSGILQNAPAVAVQETTKETEMSLPGYLSPSRQLAKGVQTKNSWARGVTNLAADKQADEILVKKQAGKKADPLIVLNGNAVTGRTDKDYKHKSQRAMETLREEADSIVVLPDPLYIINGKEYREEELFGPNPTSPYYPLNRQEILSISILKDEEAVPYGEKGRKGVVIIITRDGKPVPPEKNNK